VAANVLGSRLAAGDPGVDDLARVQRAREWSVGVTQACQRLMQRRILDGPRGWPGVVFGLPWTRRLVSRVVALGPARDNRSACSPVSGNGCSAAPRIPWLASRAARPG
jgi:hypothetical protein